MVAMAEASALIPKKDEGRPHEQQSLRHWLTTAGLASLGLLVLGCTLLLQPGRPPRIISGRPLLLELSESEENACDKYPYLKYEMPHAVVYSNLANKGPDHGRGEGIVYKTIALGRAAGDELNKEVYMTINATSHNYKPFSPALNGMQGKYGSINLEAGSSVDLLFSFFEAETGRVLNIPQFAITFFDLDMGSGGRSREFVTIGGFKSYHVTNSTEVKVEKQPDGRTKFSASTVGTGEDNPKDPNFLTQQQKDRAVTLLYGETSFLVVTVGTGAGSGPRFFPFVGRPSLLCAVTVQEDFAPPLPDLTFVPPMEGPVMVHRGETFLSFAVEKGQQVMAGDLIATTQKGDEPTHRYLAPFDGRVEQLQSALKPGEALDDRLSEKILAVVRRPSLRALPIGNHVIAGGPGLTAGLPKEAIFVKYLVNIGDSVSKGDAIAVVREKIDGPEVTVNASGYGSVQQRQDSLREGMLLFSVEDMNLITLAPYKSPGPLNAVNVAAAQAPEGLEWRFHMYHVFTGDSLKVGEPVATVKDRIGDKHVITATHGGIVTGLVDLKLGDPLDRVAGGHLCTVGKFAPLPMERRVTPISMTGATGIISPLVGEQERINPDGLKFERFYVRVKDIVDTGNPVAQVLDRDGQKHDLLAPRPGIVQALQDGLRKGMLLEHVLQDQNLLMLGPLPVLEVSDDEEGAFAPVLEHWQFKEWRVQVGWDVRKGDAIAILEQPSGAEKEVHAGKSGTVHALLQHIQPGDVVEQSTKDSDLATIGPFHGPDIAFREMGVQTPSMDCMLVQWQVGLGDKVHLGDPVAAIDCPMRRLDGGRGRRLQENYLMITAPVTGWINYLADLQVGQSISEQSLSPTIAKVNLGTPWWLTLMGLLLILCGGLSYLSKVMQKPPVYDIVYKPMPEDPKPIRAPKPIPEIMEPVILLQVDPEPLKDIPDGLKLDFEDTEGKVRTVWAKYKPLGIKHNHEAPIIAHDFTVNSYAKQELGVQVGWKLVRIWDEEVLDSENFDDVNTRLAVYTHDFPVWPLALEFRKEPNSRETHIFRFSERPLGVEFTNVAPIKVDRVYEDSPAADQHVEVGWFLTKIGEFNVQEHPNMPFREVLRYFKEGVQGLADNGKTYHVGEGSTCATSSIGESTQPS